MDLPHPGADLAASLRALKIYAGDPSYTVITERINRAGRAAGRPADEDVARGTVVDCFKPGRRRVNADLVIAVVRALHDDAGYANQWRQALRVAGGSAQQVRVFDALPPDLPEFTGRHAELARLSSFPARFVVTVEGMPGVGKTQLAVRMAHRLVRRRSIGRVLYVNLRGFHSDPAQPSADPAAVLDAFLRLLGVPGGEVPHRLAARAALYRARLADEPTLVVLDNAADEAHVRHLVGELTVITSRRRLAALTPTDTFHLDVFTADEARAYLERSMPGVAVGGDPAAADRLAARCGGLPLALSLVVGHMRGAPGWTLTDHADRLDERYAAKRLESGIEMTLGQSYQGLSRENRRLFRLLALHPGPDFDGQAVASLESDGPCHSGLDPGGLCHPCLDPGGPCHLCLEPGGPCHSCLDPGGSCHSCRESGGLCHPCLDPGGPCHLCLDPGGSLFAGGVGPLLRQLEREHLVRGAGGGRFVMHDLVRAFAADRGIDEDSSADRRAALARLGAYYTAAAAAAMDRLHPAETAMRRPLSPTGVAGASSAGVARVSSAGVARVSSVGVVGVSSAGVAGASSAGVARVSPAGVAPAFGGARAAKVWLDTERPVLVAMSGLADDAALVDGRVAVDLSIVLFRYLIAFPDEALQLHGNARVAARALGDPSGEASALVGLGVARCTRGDHEAGARDLRLALDLFRSAGDRLGEGRALMNLGSAALWRGRHGDAVTHMTAARELFLSIGATTGATHTLTNIAYIDSQLGRHASAVRHLERALAEYRAAGSLFGEAIALTNLGIAENALGDPARAAAHFERAVTASRLVGDRTNEADALEGLAGTRVRLGDPAGALAPLWRSLDLCREVGYRRGEVNTLIGLGDAVTGTGDPASAAGHYRAALAAAGSTPDQRARAEAGLNMSLSLSH